jgi:glycosyltransferase involved in cell wall biosynthesis
MSLKNILILVPTLKGGGAERVAAHLASILYKNENFKIKLCVFDISDQKFDVDCEIHSLCQPARQSFIGKGINFFKRAISLKRLIKLDDYDYVISFMESANILNIFCKKVFYAKYQPILTVHNNLKSFPKYYLYAIRLVYKYSYKIIAVSDGVRKDIINQNINLKQITEVIYNPVDDKFFTQVRMSNNKRKIKRLIAVGSLSHQKGFDLLLSSIALLKDNTNKFHLDIYGTGPLKQYLEEKIVSLKLSNLVSLCGYEKHIEIQFASSDIFILSSRYEGFGNVLVEAMASGCFPISFDISHGPSEIMLNTQGLLVEAGNTFALAETIKRVLDSNFHINFEMRDALRSRAYHFHINQFEKSWLNLF